MNKTKLKCFTDDNYAFEDAIRCLNDFSFGRYDDSVNLEDFTRIPIAYTTTEDDKHEISAFVNLVNCSISKYVDDVLVEFRKSDNLVEFIKNELICLSFDELVSVEQ